MIFNSVTFLVFLLIVYAAYWRLRRRGQNGLLVLAGYVFYGWWDWRFLSLLLFSSSIDYAVGYQLGRTDRVSRRKALLGLSVVTQLGLLGFFKYFNFFAEGAAQLGRALGVHISSVALHIVLPVGLSFYTFQTLSYTIDVYRRRCVPHRSLLDFMAFVSFFPQLVAGPIERASQLLPQFAGERRFDPAQAKDGLRQMLWGTFQKVVVADGLAAYVDWAYAPTSQADGAHLLLGTYFFAFQIYGDFCGYTNIAIGCARLFGFELRRNFATPYFSRHVAEFWQRWHISLSSWFRDYVYIPLGGSRGGRGRTILNTLIVFTLSGLWHGAAWHYVVWGVANGLLLIPHLWRRPGPSATLPDLTTQTPLSLLGAGLQRLLTFHLILGTWVFFRAADLGQAGHIFRTVLGGIDLWPCLTEAPRLKALIAVLLVVEWCQRAKPHALEIAAAPGWLRWSVYYALLLAILWLGTFTAAPFIYFQF
jgi:alginate O-acetyltransferase complex protein AlgI